MTEDPQELSAQIARLRRPHVDEGLEIADLDPDPIVQFAAWMDDALAAEPPLPNAMTLATADADGRPSARTVLLKGFDDDGFTFFTNYGSRKARDLEANPVAALVLSWIDIERQVTIRGPVEKLSRAESEDYFATRPLGSRLGAWASQQSEVIPDRGVLERALEEVGRRFAGGAIPCPPFWGGFRVRPDEIEFWQARPNRMHDRFRYRRGGEAWIIERLSP